MEKKKFILPNWQIEFQRNIYLWLTNCQGLSLVNTQKNSLPYMERLPFNPFMRNSSTNFSGLVLVVGLGTDCSGGCGDGHRSLTDRPELRPIGMSRILIFHG